MHYLDLFSGISAPTVAWKPLGWQAVAYAEIEKFPSAVLAHHYPTVPNVGDVTKVDWDEWKGKADLAIAGSPCQSFSTAGKRRGLDDERGNLALEAIRIARRVDARWFILENAPGILSANKGYAFARILHEMEQCGYGFSYRVLDAKHFGVPQRRRRVYLVGHFGDWRTSARVLFEQGSLQGTVNKVEQGWSKSTRISEAGFSLPIGFNRNDYFRDIAYNLSPTARKSLELAVIHQGKARLLTVNECLRVQGFPDNYLDITYRGKPATKSPQKAAIGNSMAVPVIRWLGERIEQVESRAV